MTPISLVIDPDQGIDGIMAVKARPLGIQSPGFQSMGTLPFPQGLIDRRRQFGQVGPFEDLIQRDPFSGHQVRPQEALGQVIETHHPEVAVQNQYGFTAESDWRFYRVLNRRLFQ